jgi:hypothetical protein
MGKTDKKRGWVVCPPKILTPESEKASWFVLSYPSFEGNTTKNSRFTVIFLQFIKKEVIHVDHLFHLS